jgi:hypothetical protein
VPPDEGHTARRIPSPGLVVVLILAIIAGWSPWWVIEFLRFLR